MKCSEVGVIEGATASTTAELPNELPNELPEHFQIWLKSWFCSQSDFVLWFQSLGAHKSSSLDCQACSRSQLSWQRSSRVKPNLKCCTFQPFVPNFIVGELLNSQKLQSEDLERGRSIPLGLVASSDYVRNFRRLSELPQFFGNEPELLCSHFDVANRQCRIWPARPSVCSTYFCDLEAEVSSCFNGELSSLGRTVNAPFSWARLEKFLFYIEVNLAHHVLLELGFIAEELESNLNFLKQQSLQRVSALALNQNSANDSADRVWYEFHDTKASFFIKAAEYVSGMTPNDIWECVEPDLLNF